MATHRQRRLPASRRAARDMLRIRGSCSPLLRRCLTSAAPSLTSSLLVLLLADKHDVKQSSIMAEADTLNQLS